MTAAPTAFSAETEHLLFLLLLQIAAILVAARAVGAAFRRLGQSETIGQIAAGLLLGPSFFGWLCPSAFQWLFPAHGPQLLPFFSHIGLVLTLFLIGMEFDYSDIPRHGGQVIAISLSTIALPMAAGAAMSWWLWDIAPGSRSFLSYALFIGMTIAITAIPIMGRVLMEMNLSKTRVGTLAVTTGAVKDLFMWFLLTVVIGIAKPPLDLGRVAGMVLATAALGVFALTAGRKVLAWAERLYPVRDGRPHPNLLSWLLIALMVFAAATSKIGIFAIFGSFLAGVMVSHRRDLAAAVSDRIHDLTVLLFLPIFFSYTGLRADVTQLSTQLGFWLVAITVIGFLANAGPAYLLSRWAGSSREESIAMGVLINMPGLMELILLNVGLDLGVFPSTVFSVLLVTGLLRNLIATPVLRRVAEGLPLLKGGTHRPLAAEEPL